MKSPSTAGACAGRQVYRRFMPPSREGPEVSRRILDTMATLTRAHQDRTAGLLERIERETATLVDLDQVARLSNLTAQDIFAMARDDLPLDLRMPLS